MKYFEWRGEKVSQFVLGAAQLGMNYGITNQTGQPNKKEAFAILDEAVKNGVTTIDTAQAYGNSEEIIGQWLEQNNNKEHHIHIISKWDANIDIKNKEQLKSSAQTSAKNLGVPLWGMMIHDEMYLNHLDVILIASKELKNEGVLKYLGASVYSVDAAKKAIMNPDIDFIQVPCNAWDHRMIDSGVFELAQKNNTLCFVRSVFLQGLLLMNENDAKEILPESFGLSSEWNSLISNSNQTNESMALSFVNSLNLPLVIGQQGVDQFKNNCDSLKNARDFIFNEQLSQIIGARFNDYIVSPQLWKKQ
ncbi:MAG: aldo/keto reductase [Candidatus Margulisbacteria bacterium]|nr:aldo/keto reductase [Candidatus Margulisiibacteriota bacterium]